MKEYNWKLRFMNKDTLNAMIALAVSCIYDMLAILGIEPIVEQQGILYFCRIIIVILVARGIVVDPTTEGSGDSKQALQYDKPKPKEQ